MNYYAVVFLLRPPNSLRRGPFFGTKNVCNSQETGVRARRTAIVNHPAVLKILRVVNLLRVVFLVRWGPLGKPHADRSRQTGGANEGIGPAVGQSNVLEEFSADRRGNLNGIWERHSVASALCMGDSGKHDFYGHAKLRTFGVFRTSSGAF